MFKINMYINKYSIMAAILAMSCFVTVGCEYFPESSFQLANESRLPRWITLPPGLTRSDATVTMNYYVKPWGRTATFILQDAQKHILMKVDGKQSGSEPFRLKSPPQSFPPGYPSYEIITANGVTEVIEHRRQEPLFYINDDPTILAELSSIRTSQK